MIDYGQRVQLGGQKGVVFKQSQEYEALQRWTERQFLEVERNIAKQWRQSLTHINFEQMVKTVMGPLGHWRKPKSLADAKLIADNVIARTFATGASTNSNTSAPALPCWILCSATSISGTSKPSRIRSRIFARN
jgi:hypothetical protein